MASQAQLEDAKSQWLQAAEEAQSQKDQARSAYDNEKSEGYTDYSFTQWVVMNYPSFNAAYHEYEAAEAHYMAAFSNVDDSGRREWHQKKMQEIAPLLAKGGDESQFIIYTGEE
ncbi:hypothetical protein HG530_015058 [Fusarium avenaceum]|nr:hypothetical protein HG530_015058 [Fusarium avenaceum]